MADIISNFISKITKGKQEDVPNNISFLQDGTSGIEIYSGYYQEEYLPTFQSMPEGMDVYDKMRRSDYQVKMLTSAVRNPILGGKWSIEIDEDNKQATEMKEFLEHVLFEDISYPDGSKSKTWHEFINEALTMIEFGYSAFEIVHKIVNNHKRFGTYIGLRDLGFRSQKTIYEWHLKPRTGAIDRIRQRVDGDLNVDVEIPGEDLLVFTINKEGDNYEGISLLRPIYGNWFRKNQYFKFQSVGVERSSTGVPIGTMPAQSSNDTDKFAKFKNIMRRFTAHQRNYIIIPEGYDLKEFKVNHDPEKLDKVIDNEDKRMAKAFLANFLELAMTTSSGSFALGEDLSDVFLDGIQHYAEMIASQVQKRIVEPLIIAKYGVQDDYPKLAVSGINNKAGKEVAEIATMLKNAGLITDSDQLEDKLNTAYDFPLRSKEQKEKDEAEGNGRTKKNPAMDNQNNEDPNNTENADKKAKEDKTKFSEKKSSVSALMDSRALTARDMMRKTLTERTETYLKSTRSMFKREFNPSKRRAGLKALKMPNRNAYVKDLKSFLAMTSDRAVRGVLGELGMQGMKFDEAEDILKELPPAVRAKVKAEVGPIVDAQDDELRKRMFFIVSQKLETTEDIDALISDMRNAADAYITGSALTAAATNAVSGAINTARNAVFQTEEVFEEIESFEIINPSPEAPICRELTGRVFTKAEYKTADLPPYHHNCKTTVRAQLQGAKSNKPVNPIGLRPTGTPSQIAAILKSKTFNEA